MAWNPFRRKQATASQAGGGWLAKVEDGDRLMGRLGEEKSGIPYRKLESLDEARQHPDAAVILEADYGGQVMLTAPIGAVRCDEPTLTALLVDLAELEWKDPDLGASRVYYERLPAGSPVWGGMGGGRVTADAWVHADLFAAGVEQEIRGVLRGDRPRVFPEGSARTDLMARALQREDQWRNLDREILKPANSACDSRIPLSYVESALERAGAKDVIAQREFGLGILEYSMRSGHTVLGDWPGQDFEPWPARTEQEAIARLAALWAPEAALGDLEGRFCIQKTFSGSNVGHWQASQTDPSLGALLDGIGTITLAGLDGLFVPRDKIEAEARHLSGQVKEEPFQRLLFMGISDGYWEIVDTPSQEAPRVRWSQAMSRGLTHERGPPFWVRNTTLGNQRGHTEKWKRERPV